MKNISNIKNCYGCGVCATICPKKIITIGLNKYGFYEPNISHSELCIDCGLCLNVCSYTDNSLSKQGERISCYSGWSNDMSIRLRSSSGGVSYEIAKFLISEDYKICGVRYNLNKQRAEHYIATTIEELDESIGSKYIPSYTIDAFNEINKKDKYLVIGTPCHIDSFRRYIKKLRIEDNFILIDFFCHGVPSMNLWEKYLNQKQQRLGKIKSITWRNKYITNNNTTSRVDWHDSYNIIIQDENKAVISSRYTQYDPFYCAFFSDTCLNSACYDKCKFKRCNSSADIRIGDLWGKKYKNNKDGVSGVITFTPKGDKIIQKVNCTFFKETLDIITEGQMHQAATRGKQYNKVTLLLLNKNAKIEDINNIIIKPLKKKLLISRLKNPLRTLKNIKKQLFH